MNLTGIDFIKIRGLDSARLNTQDPSKFEIFQGIAGGSSTVTTEDGSTPAATVWEAIPEGVVNQITDYTSAVIDWLQQAEDYTPPEGSRGSLLPAIPAMPSLVAGAGAIAATGGAAVPAIATMMITQAIMNLAGSQLESIRENLDPNSPRNLFKKAFLYTDSGGEQSILNTGLLADAGIFTKESLLKIINEAIEDLKEPIQDLKYNDEEVDFGGVRVHLRGKVIEP